MMKFLKNALLYEVKPPTFPPITKKLLFFSWFGAALFLFLPLPWATKLQLYGNSDSLFYTNILSFISERLHHGELFPRWFADANAGMGTTAMLFYAPLSYTITAFINAPFTWLHLNTGQQFFLGIFASQIASAFTSYIWLKRQFSPKIAFIGSMFYVLLPYKLIYIYLHFNLAVLWALVFLPLWMLAAEEICDDNVPASPALYALGFAATYYCHPLTVLAFCLIPLGYVVLLAPANHRVACYFRLVLAHILAIAICLWQAYPQFAWLDWIHPDEFLKGRLHWEGNFFHLDVFLCFYYGLAALLICYGALRLPLLFSSTRFAIFFWTSVIVVTTFMTQRISNPIWQHIVILQYLQFPAARLHAGALLAVVYLFCIWLSNVDILRPLGPAIYRPSVIFLCILFFAFITICRVKNIYSDGTLSNKDYLGNAQYAKIIPVLEYKTLWGCGDGINAITLYRNHTMPPLVDIKEGKATLFHINWQPPKNITINTEVRSANAGFVLRQCYIPLWQATDENGNQLVLKPTAEYGLIHISLPKGTHTITVSMEPPATLKHIRFISWTALGICLAWLLTRIWPLQTLSRKHNKEIT